MSNTFEFADRFGYDPPFNSEEPSTINGFKNSPFGQFWETAIYTGSEVIVEDKSFKIRYQISVSDDINFIREKYNTQVVEDNVIKLYLFVQEKNNINFKENQNLRNAFIRHSNIVEYVGVVLGDSIYDKIQNDKGIQEKYVNKLVAAFFENDSQKESIKTILNRKFTFYLNNKRSSIFQIGLVGKLIQQELKKDLQQFWKPVLTSLAKEIRTYKFEDEKYWQPYTKNGSLKSSKEYTPFLGNSARDVQEFSTQFLNSFNAIDSVLQNYLNLNKFSDAKNLKAATQNLLKQSLAKIYNLFKDILSYFKDGILNFIKDIADKFYELNAFLVGVVNGVIEFVASLVDLVGFMAGLISGDAEILWQAVLKELKVLEEKGGFIYFFEKLGEFFDSIENRYDSEQSKYKVLKNLGEDLIGLVEFVIGAIAIYKAGKVVLNTTKKTYDAFKKKIDDVFSKKEKEFDDLDEIVKSSQKLARKATQLDIDNLTKIRKRFNAGKRKNVSQTKGEIDGKIIDLQSRSGVHKGTPKNFDSFETIKPDKYKYKNGPEPIKVNHTEQKQIEYLYNRFKNNKSVSGKIEIVSDLKICDNCDWIIDAFQKDFPNIEIVRVWIKTKL